MDEAIFKLIGEAVKSGYGLPIIAWFLWDKWKDREERKELSEKKKSGEYVSWESMNERIKSMDEKMNGHATEFKELKDEYKSHMVIENLEEGRFTKLESGHDHLKENIGDIKESLAEMKRDINQGFSIMADIKNIMLQQKGH